jgi:hypothetical protein
VNFTAYFDETDTHGPAPTVILAAYVGHDYQWQRFNKKLTRLQAHYGFSIFHATEFKARSGEFSGWSDEKCAGLISNLTDLVRYNLTEGIAGFLSRDRYLNEYRAPPIPKKMNLDSQYGACFRACMARLFDLMATRFYRDRLDVVMEDGHPNARDCERIFNDLKGYLRFTGQNFLGGFSIERKHTCPPLMVADLLAATYSVYRAATAEGTLDPAAVAKRPERKGSHLSFLELGPDALRDLKLGFEKMRELKKEAWQARKVYPQKSSKSNIS